MSDETVKTEVVKETPEETMVSESAERTGPLSGNNLLC